MQVCTVSSLKSTKIMKYNNFDHIYTFSMTLPIRKTNFILPQLFTLQINEADPYVLYKYSIYYI